MKITVHSVEEFLLCLEDEKEVFDDSIRFTILKIPTDESSKNPVVFDVLIAFGVIILVGDQHYFLLGEVVCGKDYEDADQNLEGTEVATQLGQKLHDFAQSRSWKLKPGVISD